MKRLLRRVTGITLGLAVALAVGWTARPASATILRELGLGELVRQADRVVVARVEARVSRWEGGRIVTDVTLRVEETAKGDARVGERVVVTTMGGSVDGIGMKVVGEAAFVKGETALVFLTALDAGWAGVRTWEVVGMAQGRMPVTVDAATGLRQVRADLAGASLLVKDRRGKSVVTAAVGARLRPRPLTDVVAEVRALVSR